MDTGAGTEDSPVGTEKALRGLAKKPTRKSAEAHVTHGGVEKLRENFEPADLKLLKIID